MKKEERRREHKIRKSKASGKKCVEYSKRKITSLQWNIPKWQNDFTAMEQWNRGSP